MVLLLVENDLVSIRWICCCCCCCCCLSIHIGVYRCVLMSIDTYRCVSIHTYRFVSIPICINILTDVYRYWPICINSVYINTYISVCVDTHRRVSILTNMYRFSVYRCIDTYISVCIDTHQLVNWYAPICIDTHRIDTYWSVSIHVGEYRHKLICMYWYTLN